MNKNELKKKIQTRYSSTAKVSLKDITITDIDGVNVTAEITQGDYYNVVGYDSQIDLITSVSKSISNDIKQYITAYQPSDMQLKAGITSTAIECAMTTELSYIKSDVITERELEAMLFTSSIHSSNYSIDNSREQIAKCLMYIYKNELYTAYGYSNIYEYAAEVFGLSRGSVSNYINVVRRFYPDDAFDSIENYSNAHIIDKYSFYSFAQLNLLKLFDDKAIEELDISYIMSCRQIAAKIHDYTHPAITDNKQTAETADDTAAEKAEETDNTAADADTETDTEDGATEDYIPNAKGNKPNATLVVTGYSGLLASESLLQSIMKTNKFRVEFYRVED